MFIKMKKMIDYLNHEYDSNKSKFKDDEIFKFLHGYEIQRLKGKYNPFSEGNKVMKLIGCNDSEQYFNMMWNYGTLMPKYFPEYCKKYYPDLLK